ncbi:MAG: hypothetical protein GY774_28775, partial [Planctomycetes bacterium]|nr:hypothetical protein [Planctomycetota bacterium]
MWGQVVSKCYSMGSVIGTNMYIGGFIGCNSGNVAYCYNVGSVTVRGDGYIGGLVGENLGDVNNCYSIGSVSGTSRVGG